MRNARTIPATRFVAAVLAAVLSTATAALVAQPAAAAGLDEAVPLPSQVAAGTNIRVGGGLQSPDGRITVRLEEDGNLVMRGRDNGWTWDTNTAGSGGDRLEVQTDGNLVIYDDDRCAWSDDLGACVFGVAVWTSRTQGEEGGALRLLNSGNLVFYAREGFGPNDILWNADDALDWSVVSYTLQLSSGLAFANRPTHILSAGQRLDPNESMTSPNGHYTLEMRGNGNLALYGPDGAVVWKTNTVGPRSPGLAVQTDGNLVLYDDHDVAVWNSQTWGAEGGWLVLDDDGRLDYFSPQGEIVWESDHTGSWHPTDITSRSYDGFSWPYTNSTGFDLG